MSTMLFSWLIPVLNQSKTHARSHTHTLTHLHLSTQHSSNRILWYIHIKWLEPWGLRQPWWWGIRSGWLSAGCIFRACACVYVCECVSERNLAVFVSHACWIWWVEAFTAWRCPCTWNPEICSQSDEVLGGNAHVNQVWGSNSLVNVGEWSNLWHNLGKKWKPWCPLIQFLGYSQY